MKTVKKLIIIAVIIYVAVMDVKIIFGYEVKKPEEKTKIKKEIKSTASIVELDTVNTLLEDNIEINEAIQENIEEVLPPKEDTDIIEENKEQEEIPLITVKDENEDNTKKIMTQVRSNKYGNRK